MGLCAKNGLEIYKIGVSQGGVLIIQRYSITKKSHAPTLNMVETFYSKNGVPIEEDVNWGYDSRYELFKPHFRKQWC